jgi:predicted acylesterase/phospholipase RssA
MVTSPRIQIPRKKKVALVLSGGGTKAAAFHLGATFALLESGFTLQSGLQSAQGRGLPPDAKTIQTYVGSSAGSFIASLFASGYSLENITASFLKQKTKEGDESFFPRSLPRLQYKKMFKLRPEIAMEQAAQLLKFKGIIGSLVDGNFPSLLQLRWLKMSGFFSTAGIEQFLREEVLPSNRFEDYRAELFIIGTKLNESRKVVFGKNRYDPPQHDPSVQYQTHVKIADAVAASTALPVLFSPYSIPDEDANSHFYIDGEIRETLSTHVAVDSGADLVITSYTHQPYRMLKGMPSLTTKGLPAIVLQAIYVVIEQKINSVLESYRSKKTAMNEVYQYCKDQNLSDEHVRKIMDILESELHQRRNLDIIPIHPDPTDSTIFSAEHFTLNVNKLNEMVKSGYKAGKSTLSKYEFEG